MGQRERNFVINEMYPFWKKNGMSDKNSERFYSKAFKVGMDVTVLDGEFQKNDYSKYS